MMVVVVAHPLPRCGVTARKRLFILLNREREAAQKDTAASLVHRGVGHASICCRCFWVVLAHHCMLYTVRLHTFRI